MIQTLTAEKLSNYEDLQIEVSRLWKVRTKIVSVVTGSAISHRTTEDHTN